MNRRGNGLSADTYAPLIDLTPELADVMLTALREAGIAAYASAAGPPDSATEPATAATEAASAPRPDREKPLDRLYVDTSMRSTAESVLHLHLTRLREEYAPDTGTIDTGTADTGTIDTGTETGAPAERDDDAVWAEIVASFESAPEGGTTPWPDEENIDDAVDDDAARDEHRGDGQRDGQDRTGRLPTARVIKPADPSEAPPAEHAGVDDHFVPPPPPPLPEGDTVTRAAWAALLGGPLYLLLTVLLGWEVPGWAAFLAVAAFIGGFVTLVLRMGDDPRGPDDGAVV